MQWQQDRKKTQKTFVQMEFEQKIELTNVWLYIQMY
jgi:hypothetical protein